MPEVQRGRADLAVQAAHLVHPQPEPEGRAQLRPLPARLQRQGGEVPGRGAPAEGIPLPIHRARPLPGGGCLSAWSSPTYVHHFLRL